MPSAPPRVCARCKRLAVKGKPCQCRPAWEGSTHTGSADKRWVSARDDYLRSHPFCEKAGCTRIADAVDHVKPLAEGGDKYDPENFQSLCDPHHTEKTTQDALRGKTRAR
ncbi:HNH endonuclease [Mycobacteroides chelonae]|uniref:HNH endonuclease n=1 Tax=Mycobacteroides chelonae TaxID=1774 RepID=A0AB73U4L4_MYCCH|nr:HNH endonuclease [Mycobacteroides chelonae]